MSPTIQWRGVDSSDSSTFSRRSGSDKSYQSQSTAPTDYSYRPALVQYEPCYETDEGYERECFEYDEDYDERSSVDTYASTLDEDEYDDDGDYEVPSYTEVFPTDAIPATPRDFAELFPSSQKLSICHDDATIDGNMNLRVDASVETRRGKKQLLTLFHLRMHDLKSRDFSLRRYCRESGREVCHSSRKYQKPASERPGLQRSLSNALATLRHKSDSRPPTASGLKRQDSGYESMDDTFDSRPKTPGSPKGSAQIPTNTIKLEFSNYAHVDIKRRGNKANKRYDFEYWGVHYTWRRMIKKRENGAKETSYHLLRPDCEYALAHIVPVRLDPIEAHEEAAKGGWIPPCTMWISDERILRGVADVSDVVISTGLIALVDDNIKTRFHSKQTTQLLIPLTRNSSFKMNMEYIDPKRLIDEVFHRNSRNHGSSRQPMLRRISVEA